MLLRFPRKVTKRSHKMWKVQGPKSQNFGWNVHWNPAEFHADSILVVRGHRMLKRAVCSFRPEVELQRP